MSLTDFNSSVKFYLMSNGAWRTSLLDFSFFSSIDCTQFFYKNTLTFDPAFDGMLLSFGKYFLLYY